MADDEDYRIEALREELMRQVDGAKHEIERIGEGIDHRFDKVESAIKGLRWWFMALVGVGGLILAGLAYLANIF